MLLDDGYLSQAVLQKHHVKLVLAAGLARLRVWVLETPLVEDGLQGTGVHLRVYLKAAVRCIVWVGDVRDGGSQTTPDRSWCFFL